MRRVEPMLLLVCLGLFAHQASSACTASITVSGADQIIFVGDVASRLIVTCGGGGTATVASRNGMTGVICPWHSMYTKAWAAPSNDPTCTAVAPANVTVDEGTVYRSIAINSMAAVAPATLTSAVMNTMGQGVPLQDPTLYSGVVLTTGAASVDIMLQNVDVGYGYDSALVPVIIQSGSVICNFGYLCIVGSCLNMKDASSNLCVQYGFDTPVPAPCSQYGSGGMNCGQNCTSLTCTSMCPSFDCTMARACQLGDAAYPCHECQCPENCTRSATNHGPTLTPELFPLGFVSLTILFY